VTKSDNVAHKACTSTTKVAPSRLATQIKSLFSQSTSHGIRILLFIHGHALFKVVKTDLVVIIKFIIFLTVLEKASCDPPTATSSFVFFFLFFFLFLPSLRNRHLHVEISPNILSFLHIFLNVVITSPILSILHV
jgi:hypothetical protein